MANETRIQIIISADGTVAVEQIGKVADKTDEAAKKTKSAVATMKEHWLGLSAAAASAMIIIGKAQEYMHLGAMAMQAEEAFRNVSASARYNADHIIAEMQRVTVRTIDDSDLMQRALKGITQGMTDTDMIKIAETARITARTNAIDVAQSMERITDSIANNMPRALRAMGLVTKEEMAVINKAIAAGADDINLLEIAYLNAQIKAKQMALETESVNEVMQRHRAEIAQVKENLGIGLVTVLGEVAGWLNTIARGWEKFLLYVEETSARARAFKESNANLRAGLIAQADFLKQQREQMGTPPAAAGKDGRTIADLEDEKRRIMDQARAAADKANRDRESARLAEIQAEIEARYDAKRAEVQREYIKTEEQFIFATAQAIQKDLETRLAYEDKIDQFRQRAKVITDEEAIRNRYGREHLSLEGKLAELDAQRAVLNQNEYGNAEKLRELGLKELEIRNQLLRLKEYEVMDLDERRRATDEEHLKKLTEAWKKQAEMQRSDYNAQWSGMMDMANQVGGEAGQGLGKTAASMKGIADVYAGYDPWTEKTRRAQEHYNAIREMELQGLASEYETQAAYDQLNLQREQAYQQQRIAIASNSFGALAGLAQAFYALSGNQNKTAFAAFKAFSIAQTMINTYSAAMGAYSAMASIPYVGPFLGVAAAAAAIAFGMAQVSAIARMQPGGGVSTSASPSGGGGYSYTQPTTPSWEETGKQAQRPQLVANIYVNGVISNNSQFAREIMPELKKAWEDNA